MSLNQVVLMGRLTRDPELKSTQRLRKGGDGEGDRLSRLCGVAGDGGIYLPVF